MKRVRCSSGHPTVPDPPGSPLVRLPCGCAVATATDEALVRECGYLVERELLIRLLGTVR